MLKKVDNRQLPLPNSQKHALLLEPKLVVKDGAVLVATILIALSQDLSLLAPSSDC